jgi:hypothetical protein
MERWGRFWYIVKLRSKSAFTTDKYTSYPRADGAKRRARVLIPPGYLHPGKRKH